MEVVDGLVLRGPLAVALGPFHLLHAGQRARLRTLAREAAELSLAVAVVELDRAPEPAVWPRRWLSERLAALGVCHLLHAHGVDLELLERWLCSEASLLSLPAGGDAPHPATLRLASLGDPPWRRVSSPAGGEVSPDAVAHALGTGDFARVARLLGEPYVLGGQVVQGEQLGRRLGVPTANLELGEPSLCLRGVYAARVQVEGQAHRAMAYVGMRPSVGGSVQRLEAHLLDFDGDLYGKSLSVQLLAPVAGEARLPTLDALRERIHENLARVRAYFARATP